MDDEFPPIQHRRAWAAAMVAFLAHNAEEVALDLPAWSESHTIIPWLGWMGPPGAFTIAIGLISLAVGAVALYAIATGPRWSRLALEIIAIVMLVNAATHVTLSVVTSTLMPGVVTAALVVAPVMTGVLWAVRRVRA